MQRLAFSGGPPSTSPSAAIAIADTVPLVVEVVTAVSATDEAGNPPDDDADDCAAPFAGVDAAVVAEGAVKALPPRRSTVEFNGEASQNGRV